MARQERSGSVQRLDRFLEDRVIRLEDVGHPRRDVERDLDVGAGGRPVGWVALAVELQRDWAREETVDDVIEIVLTERLLRP